MVLIDPIFYSTFIFLLKWLAAEPGKFSAQPAVAQGENSKGDGVGADDVDGIM